MMNTITPRRTLFNPVIVFYAAQKNGKNASQNKIRRFLKKCDVYIIQKKSIGSGNSRPCNRCLDFLKKVGIRRIYYSFYSELKMEKINIMESDHVSSKYRKSWAVQKQEGNAKKIEKIQSIEKIEKKEIKNKQCIVS